MYPNSTKWASQKEKYNKKQLLISTISHNDTFSHDEHELLIITCSPRTAFITHSYLIFILMVMLLKITQSKWDN